jgi:hypothetical protein
MLWDPPKLLWIPEILLAGVKRPELELTIHLYLVLKLMRRVMSPLHQYVFMA